LSWHIVTDLKRANGITTKPAMAGHRYHADTATKRLIRSKHRAFEKQIAKEFNLPRMWIRKFLSKGKAKQDASGGGVSGSGSLIVGKGSTVLKMNGAQPAHAQDVFIELLSHLWTGDLAEPQHDHIVADCIAAQILEQQNTVPPIPVAESMREGLMGAIKTMRASAAGVVN
jgi:hypothetical protein